ncbi:MAG: VWA domain-containing protein [Gammaproteobacteria bacterium]|nr:VWA domain-containing protein [Gammaproteobacteria bacterium]
MARKRPFNVFSLAFLDVMSCGFGAVILIFLIINHATETKIKVLNRDLLSENRLLDYEVTIGQRDLAELRLQVEDTRRKVEDARQTIVAVIDDVERRREDLDIIEALTIAQLESVEELKSDIETRAIEVKRLQAQEEEEQGANVIAVTGEGDRQYLTGLIVGGSHVLIAVDASASMLDDTIVNVIRRRHMSIERQLESPKWQRAVRTVEWLAAQIPIDSSFQIVRFNTEVISALGSTPWFEANDNVAMEDAIESLETTPPGGGTSLENLFNAIATMNPLPDNLYLITDGLPTQPDKTPRRATVTGRQRMGYFRDAVKRLPAGVPVNIIMFPMEGDPSAAGAFWSLAQLSGGAFMSPSADWP